MSSAVELLTAAPVRRETVRENNVRPARLLHHHLNSLPQFHTTAHSSEAAISDRIVPGLRHLTVKSRLPLVSETAQQWLPRL